MLALRLTSPTHPKINEAALPPMTVMSCDTADDIPVMINVAIIAAIVVDIGMGSLKNRTVAYGADHGEFRANIDQHNFVVSTPAMGDSISFRCLCDPFSIQRCHAAFRERAGNRRTRTTCQDSRRDMKLVPCQSKSHVGQHR